MTPCQLKALIEQRRWRRISEYENFMWLTYKPDPTWDDKRVFTPEPKRGK